MGALARNARGGGFDTERWHCSTLERLQGAGSGLAGIRSWP